MKLIRWILLLINLTSLVGMLIVFKAGSISPEKFLLPAYSTLGFPFLLFINTAFIFIWLIFKKWYFVIPLFFLIAFYPKYKNAFPLHINDDLENISEGGFSLLTYNTHMMGGFRKHTEDSHNNVIQYILDSDADIVCLQEYNVATENFITHDEMLKIFKKYPYHHIFYKNTRSNRKSGIATYSKYPIINKVDIAYESQQNASIYSDIAIGKDTVRIINCHLESNNLTEKDKALPAELRRNFDAENISHTAVTLSRKLGTAYKTRAHQSDTIASIINSSPYKTMVCGDFNDVPLSYTYNTVKGDLNDLFSEVGLGFGITYHENLYKFRIDYIFYDQNFIPLQFKRDKVKYSDHYPLFCYMRIIRDEEGENDITNN